MLKSRLKVRGNRTIATAIVTAALKIASERGWLPADVVTPELVDALVVVGMALVAVFAALKGKRIEARLNGK